ncbi:hypothetical protein [Granulicella aggregans]|uniref:hypothetical protein n=1 Tax=Granulicella aggregans TaxID=474949 RepID=UPI0021E06439|nr:hypothetical protein [Granulicella aggregans]
MSSYKVDEAKINDFTFKSYEKVDSAEACLQVVRDGRVLYQRTAQTIAGYTLGQPANNNDGIHSIANGSDLTGRGNPDMIVSLDTGGAHCCHLTYVFELQPKLKLLATIDAEDSDTSHFEDLDRDQHFYYLADDWTFAYWPSDFAESPVAPIVLRYDDGAKQHNYRLALDKMQRPVPTPVEWQEALDRTRANFKEDTWQLSFGATLWTTIIRLIYTGHSDLAWKFLDEAWPPSITEKDKWTGEFCGILKTSRYWPDLKDSMPGAPPDCIRAEPRRHFPYK